MIVVGEVDQVTGEAVVGWAADTEAPDARVAVVVEVDGTHVGEIAADRLRRDLRAHGVYGDGCHGFAFAFPTPLAPGVDHDISVRCAGTGQFLNSGRITFRQDGEGAPRVTFHPLVRKPDGDASPQAPPRPTHGGSPRYVIHIGMPKTGSKYLQYGLDLLSGRLARDGILYPRQWWGEQEIFAHYELTEDLRRGPDPKLEDVFASLNSSGYRAVVLSCEGLYDLPPESLAYLRRLLGDAEAEIVLYCRRWSDLLPSLWEQAVRQGATGSFPEAYASALVAADVHPGINFRVILEIFASVFGRDRIRIVSYSNLRDRREDMLSHFLDRVLGWRPGIEIAPRQIHESMGMLMAELNRCMNALCVARHGVAGYKVNRALYALRDDADFGRDVGTVFAAMQGHRRECEVNDWALPLRSIYDDLARDYQGLLVGPDDSVGLFERRARMVGFIGPEYLLAPGVGAAVERIHAQVTAQL